MLLELVASRGDIFARSMHCMTSRDAHGQRGQEGEQQQCFFNHMFLLLNARVPFPRYETVPCKVACRHGVFC